MAMTEREIIFFFSLKIRRCFCLWLKINWLESIEANHFTRTRHSNIFFLCFRRFISFGKIEIFFSFFDRVKVLSSEFSYSLMGDRLHTKKWAKGKRETENCFVHLSKSMDETVIDPHTLVDSFNSLLCVCFHLSSDAIKMCIWIVIECFNSIKVRSMAEQTIDSVTSSCFDRSERDARFEFIKCANSSNEKRTVIYGRRSFFIHFDFSSSRRASTQFEFHFSRNWRNPNDNLVDCKSLIIRKKFPFLFLLHHEYFGYFFLFFLSIFRFEWLARGMVWYVRSHERF